MCYQVIERYSECRCLYYRHAVDQCSSYNKPNHQPQRRIVFVGHSCSAHSDVEEAYAFIVEYSRRCMEMT